MGHIKFDGHILLFFSNAYYFWQKSKLLLAICAFTADK